MIKPNYFVSPQECEQYPIASRIMDAVLVCSGLCVYCQEVTRNQIKGEWAHEECQENAQVKYQD